MWIKSNPAGREEPGVGRYDLERTKNIIILNSKYLLLTFVNGTL
jgi:hypothetical protein